LTTGLLGVALVIANKIAFANGGWEGYAITFVALGAFVAASPAAPPRLVRGGES
jgi:hypothetical protein